MTLALTKRNEPTAPMQLSPDYAGQMLPRFDDGPNYLPTRDTRAVQVTERMWP